MSGGDQPPVLAPVSAPVLAPIRIAQADARARRQAEADRCAALLAAATPPGLCGPDAPVSPARGAMRVWRPVAVVAGSAGAVVDAGYWAPGEAQPRRAMAVVDVFDRMDRATARRADADAARLSPGQVSVGRLYRTLIERHSAGGVKLASLEGRAGGTGSGGDFMDAYLDEGRAIGRLQDRIGLGVAMAVRRIRPSLRGAPGARVITDRALVDAVCLQDMDLSAVLRAHGWSVDGKSRAIVRLSLALALDRMQGLRQKGD